MTRAAAMIDSQAALPVMPVLYGPAASDAEAVDLVADKTGHNAHDQDIGAHDHQAAILEEQRLQGDDGGHGQQPQPGPQDDESEGSADEMAGGAAGNGEIDHLRGEDEGAHDARQGNQPFVKVRWRGLQGIGQDAEDDQPADSGNQGAQETIGNVEQKQGCGKHDRLLKIVVRSVASGQGPVLRIGRRRA